MSWSWRPRSSGRCPLPRFRCRCRGIAKFDPRKRAKLGSAPIAAQLETDKKFRELVAETLSRRLARADHEPRRGRRAARRPSPCLVAAAAYLTRPPGWAEMVEAARADLEQSAAAAEGSERRSRRSPGCASSSPP